MHYQNLEQRVIQAYIDTFPPFISETGGEATESAQKQFYNFMNSVYQNLFDTPSLLFTKLNEDDFFTFRFNKSLDKKPKLNEQMRSDTKKVEALLDVLFEIGVSGCISDNQLIVDKTVKISGSHLAVFKQCGLAYAAQGSRHVFSYGGGNELFGAWKWMSTRPNASKLSVSRCLFNAEYSYATDIYSRLFGDTKAFLSLLEYLSNNGYTRIDNRDNQITLDYVKNYDKKDQPLKDSWAERTHGGISLQYHYNMEKPACISLRVPRLKELLNGSDSMDDGLKEFVLRNNKHCDNCRYCVQTDKTGTRKPACISVTLDKEYMLCPLFPGFSYCWDFLNEDLAFNIKRFLAFIDTSLKG